jgi:hypothetical protein
VAGGSFECRLDDAAFAPCLSPATYERVPLGAHTVDIRQIATDGTVGTAVTVAFAIVEAATDPPRAAPTLTVVLGPNERGAAGTAGLEATLLTDGSNAAVGCAVRGQVMRTCVVRVYAAGSGAALAAATRSAARRRVLVGVGILKAARGVVDVRLNAVGRRLLVVHGGRLPVTVDIRARTSKGVTLHAVKPARLVMTRVVVVPDLGFRAARAVSLRRPSATSAAWPAPSGRRRRCAASVTRTATAAPARSSGRSAGGGPRLSAPSSDAAASAPGSSPRRSETPSPEPRTTPPPGGRATAVSW